MVGSSNKTRRGATLPFVALLLVPIIGMVAFGIDMGYLTMTQSELQNASDASALAGATKLMQYYPAWATAATADKATVLSHAVAEAKAAAKEYSLYHEAGGVDLTLLDADIELGYLDQNGNYSSTYGTNYPNVVTVKVRRDSTANGSVSLFFAPVIGASSMDLAATASAGVFVNNTDDIESLNPGAALLPFAYDVDDWRQFVESHAGTEGISQDNQTGEYKITVYDNSDKFRGNFGVINLNDELTGVGASDIKNWVNNGVSSSDIANLESSQHTRNNTDHNWNPGTWALDDAGNSILPNDPVLTQTIDGNPGGASYLDLVPAPGFTGGGVANDGWDIGTANVPSGGWQDVHHQWKGRPGLISSMIIEINSLANTSGGIVGYLPLFEPASRVGDTDGYQPGIYRDNTTGQDLGYGSSGGNHYFYNIVGFAPVMVVPGNHNRKVQVKIFGSVMPSAFFTNSNTSIATTSTSSLMMAAPRLIDYPG